MLAFCLLVTTYPDILETISGFAAELGEEDEFMSVSGSVGLPEETSEQTVPVGTDISELELLTVLPEGYTLAGQVAGNTMVMAAALHDQGNIVYHKSIDQGTPVSGIEETGTMTAAPANPAMEGMAVPYRYQGIDKDMSYVTLTNGMRYVLTALEQEMTASARHLALLILIGALVAVAAAGVIGMFMGMVITRPITQIDDIVYKTVRFSFSSNENSDKLC